MIEAVRAWWRGRAERLGVWALSRFVWVAEERRTFNGDSSDEYALVAVIGREHYVESRKRYPILNRADLGRVIEVEKRGREGLFSRIGPVIDSSREVQFFCFSETLKARSPRAVFWVPESLVLALSLSDEGVATVRRGQFCYFISSRGRTQISGGGIVSPTLFRMAAGIPLSGLESTLDDEGVLSILRRFIFRIKLEDWWNFRGPDFHRLFRDLWRPVIAITSVIFLAYLSLASAYLSAGVAVRQLQIDRLGSEVAPLLEAQRRIDFLSSERATMRQVVESRTEVWPMWEIAAEVWAAGGAINSLTFRSGDVVITGTAPSAIKILERVAAKKTVAWAKFDSGVRQAAQEQVFSIRFRFVARPLSER